MSRRCGTPMAHLQPGERRAPPDPPRKALQLPAPSPARPLRPRSLQFLAGRRAAPRRPRARTRVPGCTGPTKQTAPRLPDFHRSHSATPRSGSTVPQ
ncbi:hypothetical protein NDU88_001348 [Pleurodeles waltl]|uniref:Uncharacterized protein n=1 Tax=Pleurodeles waltl TaxID=8319 RepID=A0AAV7VZY9_PLEWA|nr:hypothetical protein NDU88_001348 [Pleurodeles waltl]